MPSRQDILDQLASAAVALPGLSSAGESGRCVRGSEVCRILGVSCGWTGRWEELGLVEALRLRAARTDPRRRRPAGMRELYLRLDQLPAVVDYMRSRHLKRWTDAEWRRVEALICEFPIERVAVLADRTVVGIKMEMHHRKTCIRDIRLRRQGLFAPGDLARLLRRPPATVKAWIERRGLPVQSAGGRGDRFISLTDFRAWLRGHYQIALNLERGVLNLLGLSLESDATGERVIEVPIPPSAVTQWLAAEKESVAAALSSRSVTTAQLGLPPRRKERAA